MHKLHGEVGELILTSKHSWKCREVGTVSQGKKIEEALKNLKEATELYLEEFPFKENGKPIMTVFEVAGHAKAEKALRT